MALCTQSPLGWPLTTLIVSEELDTHPRPEVEEYINWYGNWQKKTVKAQAAGVGTTMGKIFIYRGRVKQSS